ncbi:MAG: helix-turn-helix domain-containing protein, partial [Pseudomonadota bacterium]
MPGLRERNKRMKLQRIIAEARQLFVRQGFAETTIQEIAEAADVGLGTLYLYARSKEDLLVLVFRENLLQMIETSFDSIPERLPFIEQIMAFFDGHIEYHKENSILA